MKAISTFTKCMAIALLLAFGASTRIAAQTPNTDCILRQTEEALIGPTAAGVMECKRIRLYNPTHQTIAIYEIGLRRETEEWKLVEVPTLPIRLAPGKEITIGACYTPDGNHRSSEGRIRTTYICETSDHRMYAETKLIGTLKTCALRQTQSVSFPAPVPNQIRNCETIKITNTGNSTIGVFSIFLDPGSKQFTLGGLPELPYRLGPGKTIEFKACYTPDGTERCSKAAIKTVYVCDGSDHRSYAYTRLEGCLKATTSQKSQSLAVGENSSSLMLDFTVSPNPSRGETHLSVKGALSATIEIYDMLGKLLNQFDGQVDVRWDGKASDGSTLPSGSYIIRASGVDENETSFILSKNMLIVK